MKVLFTCGGTGGHINPALAVADILRERRPDCEILFVGGDGGMECTLIPKAGYRLETLDPRSFRRGFTPQALWHNVRGSVYTAIALQKAKKLLKTFKPDVILGTGGYASFPCLKVGAAMGIPICVHESNAVPGMTTRMVAGKAKKVLISFEESKNRYKNPEKVEVVGMPVRQEFLYTKRDDARKALGLDDRPLIVSAWGSLGAMDMNKQIARLMKLEQDAGCPWQHIHATGSYGWKWMPDYCKEQGVDFETADGISIREYIYDMPTLMAAADVIISRAGASTLNEIAASGTPCIIVPSPNVTENHQEKNARVLSDRGAALVIHENECSEEKLYAEIENLLSDEVRRRVMHRALTSLAVVDSAERIYKIITDIAESH